MATWTSENLDQRTPIEIAFRIDSLVQPTLKRLEATSLEALAALDINEVTKQAGIGSKKSEMLGTLILQAREELKNLTESGETDVDLSSEDHVSTDDTNSDLLFVPSLLKLTREHAGDRSCGFAFITSGQTEIHHVWLTVGSDHDVFWFDIAVDNALVVCVV